MPVGVCGWVFVCCARSLARPVHGVGIALLGAVHVHRHLCRGVHGYYPHPCTVYSIVMHMALALYTTENNKQPLVTRRRLRNTSFVYSAVQA